MAGQHNWSRTMVNYILLAFMVGILHYGWESWHVQFYTGYEGLGAPLPVLVYATGGDVMYTLLAVGIIALWQRNANWWTSAKRADLAWLALIGLGIALFVEYKAFWLGYWEYLPAMPVIPILNVGFSPIAQMPILAVASVMIVAWATNRFAN